MKNTITTVLCGTLLLSGTVFVSGAAFADDYAWDQLVALTDETNGIGARRVGTPQEKQTADWIAEQWKKSGYKVTTQPFSFELDGKVLKSENVMVDIPGQSDKVLVIGAHYDTKGDEKGSLGATDNGSGVVALLALAKDLKGKQLPYTVRLIAFGAEEFGLNGSKYYVNKTGALDNVVGMINLDTIIGGDKLYVHSAHSTPYKCDYVRKANYTGDTSVRSGLKAVSDQLYKENGHKLHPTFEGYPEGETGNWSDHAPFACSGIPIGYLEATNFAIDGEEGNDGYSQTTNDALWSCFDDKTLSACSREEEEHWGKIWHTKFDRLDTLTPLFKDRLQTQLNQNIQVLETFALEANKWVK
ncbi:M28 family metallopeptidase [Enterovibrio calviensis]|uniref:M28 family metallopeptidase n=1 Tax=Enterovibrio calviensis TaxID=91359 RepID=UPI003735FDB4